MSVAPVRPPACSDLPRGHPALLAGTAAQASTYVLLERPGPWPRRAEDVELPAAARRSLEALLAALPRARLQLVRRGYAPVERPLLVVADVRPGSRSLRGVRLEGLDALADLGAADVVAGGGGLDDVEAMTLVCTHGVRDACCARHGLDVLRALRGAGEDAWECSHTGGHRFAANAVLLPEGVVYGTLGPASAVEALALRPQGRLLLDRCRGLSALEPAAQAADTLARIRLGIDALDSLAVLSTTATGEDRWEVAIDTGDDRLRATVELRDTGLRGVESCADAAPVALREFRLVALEGSSRWG
jgi:hypothetical protein